MEVHLAIPSYQRAETLLKKTVAYLATTDWEPASKTVFVANKKEWDAYWPLLDDSWDLIIGGPTLRDQRAAIDWSYPVGTKLVCMDDDLQRLVIRLSKKKLQPLTALAAVVEQGFLLANGGLWGIYPVSNALFMQPRVAMGLVYVVGCCYGYTTHHDPGMMTTVPVKEDFERTLLHFRRDRRVTRLEWVAPVTNYFTEPGGLRVTRNRVQVFQACQDLVRRFPSLCKLSENEKSGWIDLKLG